MFAPYSLLPAPAYASLTTKKKKNSAKLINHGTISAAQYSASKKGIIFIYRFIQKVKSPPKSIDLTVEYSVDGLWLISISQTLKD